jgi:ubiquinol-cytochrome c reductase cytochrome c subunit
LGGRGTIGGRIVIWHVAALLLAQASSGVPSSSNVLSTPEPAATLAPDFAVHPSAAEVREGEHLYSVHCSSCHGMSAEGSAQAPPLRNVDTALVDFELRTGRMPAEVPHQQEYDRPPAFTRPQMNAIVAYVMTKSSGEKRLPVVQLPGKLESGRRVFAENCQQCHAATARGNAVGYRDVAPSLMDASPIQIAEAVRAGPDVMPAFGPKVINDAALADVITYVEYLQHAKYNPGGMQLANLGPVPEGFMAWIFGIGLLVLLIRRIGSTE